MTVETDAPVLSNDQALCDEVAAQLPLFPLLANQLIDTSHHIAGSVTGVCENFSGMVNRARESVREAGHLLGGGDNAQDGRVDMRLLVHASRDTLHRLVKSIERSCTISTDSAQRMDSVANGMARILLVLREIDAIVLGTRVLSVNSRIEASRLGEQGRSFAVVANEISTLARRSSEISDTIRTTVEDVNTEISTTLHALQGLAAEGAKEAAEVRGEVEHTLTLLASTHEELQRALGNSAQRSESLAADITAAIIALQFQDAVAQRLDHTANTLRSMADALTPHVRNRGSQAPDSARIQEYLTRTTMGAERRGTAADVCAENGEDIVLF
jgi:methyl-accepting chemotaxis protein